MKIIIKLIYKNLTTLNKIKHYLNKLYILLNICKIDSIFTI